MQDTSAKLAYCALRKLYPKETFLIMSKFHFLPKSEVTQVKPLIQLLNPLPESSSDFLVIDKRPNAKEKVVNIWVKLVNTRTEGSAQDDGQLLFKKEFFRNMITDMAMYSSLRLDSSTHTHYTSSKLIIIGRNTDKSLYVSSPIKSNQLVTFDKSFFSSTHKDTFKEHKVDNRPFSLGQLLKDVKEAKECGEIITYEVLPNNEGARVWWKFDGKLFKMRYPFLIPYEEQVESCKLIKDQTLYTRPLPVLYQSGEDTKKLVFETITRDMFNSAYSSGLEYLKTNPDVVSLPWAEATAKLTAFIKKEKPEYPLYKTGHWAYASEHKLCAEKI